MDEIISSYTDEDAVNDGMLWPVAPLDRLTDNLGRKLQNAQGYDLTMQDVLAGARHWIKTWGAQARRIYDMNLDGGIWVGTLHFNEQGRWTRLEPNTRQTQDTSIASRVWMIPNELGGMTLMLPEDY